jgi:putative glycerol-1-phosphate prenyltransferase
MKSSEMKVFSTILQAQSSRTPLLAVLVDPDKDYYYALCPYLHDVDMLFVGGSTGGCVDACVAYLRQHTLAPIVLFPGNVQQFTSSVDAVLFLTLLNSRRPEVLIEPHLQSAMAIYQSGVEAIPMGYILVDGERQSAVEIVSHCSPLSRDAIEKILSYAVTAQLLGKKLLYLEAGSGANTPVAIDTIRQVKQYIDIPLIVGGGIRDVQQMSQAFAAGADVVVIGNHFEQHPDQLPLFVKYKQDICRSIRR